MRHIRSLLLIITLSLCTPTFADSYGYLGFWHDPHTPQSVPQTKTTQENQNQTDAQTEIQQFCTQHDATLNQTETTGCFALTPLKNTCAAAAWSRKHGLLKPDNVVIAIHHDFHKVAKLAQKACRKQFGWFARCEVETVYCTDSESYQSSSSQQ